MPHYSQIKNEHCNAISNYRSIEFATNASSLRSLIWWSNLKAFLTKVNSVHLSIDQNITYSDYKTKVNKMLGINMFRFVSKKHNIIIFHKVIFMSLCSFLIVIGMLYILLTNFVRVLVRICHHAGVIFM